MTWRTLIFDLGDVLVFLRPRKSLKRLMDLMPADRREEVIPFLENSSLNRRYETGRIDSRQYHQGLLAHFNARFSFEEFQEIWQTIFQANQDLIHRLPRLKERVTLILLSNTNPLHADYIGRTYDIFPHFHHLIFSHEAGALKPDKRIYQMAMAKTDAHPSQCLFIDDRIENVTAAQSVGIQGHHFIDNHRLTQLLKTHGVLEDE